MANITEEFLGSAGLLQIQNGVALDSTLRVVTDQSNITSTLYLSTEQVKIGTTANDNPLALFGFKNIAAIFNTIQLSGTDKTFTFPDVSLTFAGINIAQDFTGLNNFTTTQNFNVPNGTSGTSNISIPTIPYSGGGRNANHPTLVLGSVTGSIWGLSGNGTYLGINAPTGFTGNLIDLKLNGTTVLNITQTGALTSTSSITAGGIISSTVASGNSAISMAGGQIFQSAGYSFYQYSSRHFFDLDSRGTAFNSNVYIGANSAASARLHVRSDGSSSVFRIDNSTPQRLFEVDNNNRFILGNSGLLFSWANNNFALTSQLANGYSYIFGNANTKSSASAAMGTFQLNEIVSNPSGSSAAYRGIELNYTINNSSGAVSGTATGIFLNATETALNGMTHNLMDLQRGGVSQFKVSSIGALTASQLNVSSTQITSSTFFLAGFNAITYNSTRMYFDADQQGASFGNRVYIGANTVATARLHIAAGTATAGTAPIKLTAGTNLTTPELGTLEYVDNGTTGNLYFTRNVAGTITRSLII